MKIDLYSHTGEKKGQVTLNEKIFGEKVDSSLIQEALIRQLANKRIAIAHTKDRSAVRGGGRKPYRQKGTGNARQGTIRAPHYKGGGVVFGPTKDRNFSKNMPKKQRRKALFSMLSAKQQEEQLIALAEYTNEEIKTKNLVELVKKLPVERNVLFILDKKNIAFTKSANNLSNTKTILVNYLNISDLMKYDKVVFFKNALDEMEKLFLSSEKETK